MVEHGTLERRSRDIHQVVRVGTGFLETAYLNTIADVDVAGVLGKPVTRAGFIPDFERSRGSQAEPITIVRSRYVGISGLISVCTIFGVKTKVAERILRATD